MLRYQAIHNRLKNPHLPSRWQDLAHHCQLFLQDRLGIDKQPAKRTIELDIHRMRNGHLGYYAPIKYNRENGYYYSNLNFEINQLDISSADLEALYEAIKITRNITSRLNILAIEKPLANLMDILNLHFEPDCKKYIYLEQSANEPGLLWVDCLYNAIRCKKVLNISYHPFDKEHVNHIFSPYFIKEYNNRWFTIGYEHNMDKIINLALDRMKEVKSSLQSFVNKEIDHDEMYSHVYGVTIKDHANPIKITFKTNVLLAKYLISKPIHPTQSVLHQDHEQIVFQLNVIENYEIRRVLWSYYPDLEVLTPASLKDDYHKRASQIIDP